MNVAVIGASQKPERYSYKAVKLLQEKGHQVFPVHPKLKDIEGTRVYAAAKDIPEKIDTVSLYVGAETSTKMQDGLLKLAPRRIIFNPGAENEMLKQAAGQAGIQTINGCTLVLLKTNQF